MTLPTELYRHVVWFVEDRPTLYTLLFVSRAVHDAAEAILYYSINAGSKINMFNREVKEGGLKPRDARLREIAMLQLLFHRLASVPRLASYVHELQIQFAPPKLEELSPGFIPAITAALESTTNLRVLRVLYSMGMGSPEAQSGSVLRGCTFPHLNDLGLSAIGVTQDVEQFVSRHPKLVRLSWTPSLVQNLPQRMFISPLPLLEMIRIDGSIADPLLQTQPGLKRLLLGLIYTQGHDYGPTLVDVAGSKLQVLYCSTCDLASHINKIALNWSNHLRYISYNAFNVSPISIPLSAPNTIFD